MYFIHFPFILRPHSSQRGCYSLGRSTLKPRTYWRNLYNGRPTSPELTAHSPPLCGSLPLFICPVSQTIRIISESADTILTSHSRNYNFLPHSFFWQNSWVRFVPTAPILLLMTIWWFFFKYLDTPASPSQKLSAIVLWSLDTTNYLFKGRATFSSVDLVTFK